MRAMRYHFDWSVLWTGQSGEWLLSGLLVTLQVSVVAWILAVVLGVVSGALRTAPWVAVRAAAAFYVEFFRNVPLLVWMFFWCFGVPAVLPEVAQEWVNDHGLPFLAAVCALGVYSGARFSEVIRSGIQSIPRTQFEASLASGLTVFQAYRYVILPVALRLIIPPGTSESLNLLKNSSVALTIAVAELTFQTRQIETYTARAIEALTAGTVIYLVLCLSISTVMGWVERKTAIPGLITGGRRRA
jgi:His/Glu/Gln/Arg/opine family amino acid ABC transporter permease subunit